MSNIGYTVDGVKFKTDGTRRSGDPNTSLGNTIINAVFTTDIFKSFDLDYYCFLMGDDNITVVSSPTPIGDLKLLL